jgi:hypothetical protein
MIYACDAVYDRKNPALLNPLIAYALRHGCVFGQPYRPILEAPNRWAEGIVYGLYIPAHLDKEILPDLPEDETLSCATARLRGWRWKGDIVYDRSKGFYEMMDALSEIWGSEYILGLPSAPADHTYGIYEPISQHSS